MARDEHLAFLMQGAGAWNKWRAENPNLQPDLSGSDLRRVDLIDAVLRRVNFAGADLRGQNFVDCNLQGVNLNSANLARADLSCACVTDSELVSRGELLVAGQRGGQGEECGEQPGRALVADGQPAVAGQPGEGALDDPAMAAQPGAGLDTAAGDARSDPPSAQPRPQMLVVIALVGVQLGRTPAPRTAPGPDGRNGLHQRDQRLTVVGVGRRHGHGQRQPGGVGSGRSAGP